VPNRKALAGILFVLKTGIQWEYLPQEMGCGCGMTCWRRLRDWQKAGVWDRVLQVLLDRLGQQDRIDWSRASIDAGAVRAKGGGEKTGRNPTDRGKLGSKHHLIVDRNGVPLAPPMLTPASQHDSVPLNEVLDSIRPIRQRRGRRRRRPAKLHADKAYDHRRCRAACRVRGMRASHCSARHRVADEARAVSMGRRALSRLAAQLPPLDGASWAAGGHSSRISHAGRCPDLLVLPVELNLLGALNLPHDQHPKETVGKDE
jgi:transposase